MPWVEIIKLRVAETDRASLEHQLSELISKVDRKGGLCDVKAYHNALVNSDLSIHLTGNPKEWSHRGAPLVSA